MVLHHILSGLIIDNFTAREVRLIEEYLDCLTAASIHAFGVSPLQL